MDAVLTAVLQSLPQLGLGGGSIVLVVLLLRREASTEERHAAELTRKDTLHAAEITRLRSAHDAELVELRSDVKGLRDQLDALQSAFDLERADRRKAEDDLAKLVRRHGSGS